MDGPQCLEAAARPVPEAENGTVDEVTDQAAGESRERNREEGLAARRQQVGQDKAGPDGAYGVGNGKTDDAVGAATPRLRVWPPPQRRPRRCRPRHRRSAIYNQRGSSSGRPPPRPRRRQRNPSTNGRRRSWEAGRRHSPHRQEGPTETRPISLGRNGPGRAITRTRSASSSGTNTNKPIVCSDARQKT